MSYTKPNYNTICPALYTSTHVDITAVVGLLKIEMIASTTDEPIVLRMHRQRRRDRQALQLGVRSKRFVLVSMVAVLELEVVNLRVILLQVHWVADAAIVADTFGDGQYGTHRGMVNGREKFGWVHNRVREVWNVKSELAQLTIGAERVHVVRCQYSNPRGPCCEPGRSGSVWRRRWSVVQGCGRPVKSRLVAFPDQLLFVGLLLYTIYY